MGLLGDRPLPSVNPDGLSLDSATLAKHVPDVHRDGSGRCHERPCPMMHAGALGVAMSTGGATAQDSRVEPSEWHGPRLRGDAPCKECDPHPAVIFRGQKRSHAVEVRPVLPVRVLLVHQAQEGLVDQGGSLERVIGPFIAQVAVGDPSAINVVSSLLPWRRNRLAGVRRRTFFVKTNA